MRVFVLRDDALAPVAGPADLRLAPPGSTFVLDGSPAEGDHGRWSGALGGAALRGARICWNNREEKQ